MIDHSTRRDRGFAMVALLVGMSVAAIWMTAALPAWRQQAQRQKEEELIFRGEQYARAIVLYMAKNRNALPPSIDVLVEQRFLRKKWKDPITNDDFVPMGSGVGLPGSSQPPGSSQGPGQAPGRGGQQVTAPGRGGPQGSAPPGASQQGQAVGITGVRSKSTATSIKIYQNQQQYSYWAFDAALIRPRIMGPVGGNQPGGNQPGRGGERGDQGPGAQPGRGGLGPGGPPRGGPVGPGGPGAAGPVGGRTGGSF
jgi:type II secretory pathway pseudopilin PulG